MPVQIHLLMYLIIHATLHQKLPQTNTITNQRKPILPIIWTKLYFKLGMQVQSNLYITDTYGSAKSVRYVVVFL